MSKAARTKAAVDRRTSRSRCGPSGRRTTRAGRSGRWRPGCARGGHGVTRVGWVGSGKGYWPAGWHLCNRRALVRRRDGLPLPGDCFAGFTNRRCASLDPACYNSSLPFPRRGPVMAAKFELVSDFQPAGDQPKAIEKLVEGFQPASGSRPCSARPARARRSPRPTSSPAQQADPRPRPQQDARRPALQGVQGLLPAQRRPLLRQLLRLLPARSLHPAARHLHREGRARSTRTSTGCAWPPPAPWSAARTSSSSPASRASTASARPSDYKRMMVHLKKGEIDRPRRAAPASSSTSSTSATTSPSSAASSASAATSIEVWPAYEEFALPHRAVRRRGRGAGRSSTRSPARRSSRLDELYIYPAKHFVTPEERIAGGRRGHRAGAGRAARAVQEARASCSRPSGSRRARRYDMEMLLEVGYCSGHRELRPLVLAAASRASRRTRCSTSSPTDFLLIVDESHVTLPQVRGMFAGDHSRKTTLVEHGFRLPSALDNRPLRFDEWEKQAQAGAVHVGHARAATSWSGRGGEVVEQVIRPTGLVDPVIHVKPARGQVPDLLEEIKKRADAEGAHAGHDADQAAGRGPVAATSARPGLRCKWLHSELDAIERMHDPARAARGGVRRAGRRQPAARGARPARGVAGRDPRRRQGGVPAQRDVADPDDRPGGPQRQRRGDPLRRQGDRLDAAGDRRDEPPARAAAGVQRGARHHAGDGAVGDQHAASRRRSQRTSWRRRSAGQSAARTT